MLKKDGQWQLFYFNTSNIHVARVKSSNRPASRRGVLPNLKMIRCWPRTRTRYTRIYRAKFRRSREERTRDWMYVREISKQIGPQAASCKSFADFAQYRREPAPAKKWASAISRVNYPAVSKLELPVRPANTSRTRV